MGGRGRGRGRGAGMSFNVEQLGFGRGEALPGPVTQPPPTFPPLENRPLPSTKPSSENEYHAIVRNHFRFAANNSPFYIKSTSDSHELPICWNRFPRELQPDTKQKRRIVRKPVAPKLVKRKVADIGSRLAELEEKEKHDSEGEEEDKEGKDEDEEKKEDVEDEEVADEDEEMDEGTDYVNQYFDNGEGFEEDEPDEGPVY